MKPFQSQCGAVKRAAYDRPSYDKKRQMSALTHVKALICDETIWFEPSLKPGVFVGRCKWETHNPVYKILKEAANGPSRQS